MPRRAQVYSADWISFSYPLNWRVEEETGEQGILVRVGTDEEEALPRCALLGIPSRLAVPNWATSPELQLVYALQSLLESGADELASGEYTIADTESAIVDGLGAAEAKLKGILPDGSCVQGRIGVVVPTEPQASAFLYSLASDCDRWEEQSPIMLAIVDSVDLLTTDTDVIVTTSTPTAQPSASPSATPTSTITAQLTPSQTHTATRSSTASVTPTPTATVAPKRADLRPLIIGALRTIPFAEDEAQFQTIDLQGLSVQGNVLQYRGTVAFPTPRAEGQYWELYWVGDNVVGDLGIAPTDPRVEFHWVDKQYYTENRSGILAQWEFNSDTSCRVWLNFGFYGKGRERLYALYDLRQLGASCTDY